MTDTEVSRGLRQPGSNRARSVNAFIWRNGTRPTMRAISHIPMLTPSVLSMTRPVMNASLAAVSPVPRGTRTTKVQERYADGRVLGEWTHEADRFGGRLPDPSSGRSIIYYLHGSGYLVCSTRTHRGIVARLVRRTGIGAFSLDYRLGPKHRFPAGGDDAIRGYRWLLDRGYTGDQIIVAGDSAGGHLAQDLLAANHQDGVEQPRAMALISPLYDPSFATAVAYEQTGVRDPHIDAKGASRLLRLYTGNTPPWHPRMKIELTADMDLPDTLIQHGGREVMAADARTIHENILAAGGTSEIQSWPGQGHVFQMFPYFTPDSRKAVRELKDFIDRHSRV